jgi:hypothetical protein
LGGEVRRLKVLLCYDYHNGITNEEDIIFVIELELFPIGIISLPTTIQFVITIDVEIMDIDVNITISKQEFEVQNKKKKIINNIYESDVALEDKVYPETYYSHHLKSVVVMKI